MTIHINLVTVALVGIVGLVLLWGLLAFTWNEGFSKGHTEGQFEEAMRNILTGQGQHWRKP